MPIVAEKGSIAITSLFCGLEHNSSLYKNTGRVLDISMAIIIIWVKHVTD